MSGRPAGVVSVFTGLGFGIPCVPALVHFSRTGEIWTFLGFPTYGGGPFARIGLDTTSTLLFAFLAVCAAEVVVGVLLWRAHPSAGIASLALLPFELVAWIGFALPFGPPLGLARVVLSRLTKRSSGAEWSPSGGAGARPHATTASEPRDLSDNCVERPRADGDTAA